MESRPVSGSEIYQPLPPGAGIKGHVSPHPDESRYFDSAIWAYFFFLGFKNGK